jgi:DNA invertase Pin-like site-specific DNA recombinase
VTTKLELRTLIFLYARISEDPRDLKRGVKRQVADLRRYATEELGGEIAGEYIENDVSAHSGEERPQYDLLMAAAISAAARPGVRVIIAAYHPSRLWRRRVERAQAIEDLRRAKVLVGFESGGFFNLQKATERSQLASLGESDTQESEVKSERIARASEERAQEGRANGRWGYGWQRVYEYDEYGRVIGFHDVERPEQAVIVREIVKRILAGDTVNSITADLNERGVPAPGAGMARKRRTYNQDETGSKWNKSSVSKLATRDMNVALRRHGGESYPAEWPALISESDHARVKALFSARSVTKERPGQRKHLLTWGDIAKCGVCGAWLRVGVRGNVKFGKKQELYLCDVKDHVGRNKAALDGYVRDLVTDRLSRPDALDLFAAADDDAVPRVLGEIAGLRARLDGAADDYAEGAITREQMTRITSNISAKIEEAQARLRSLQPMADVDAVADLAHSDPTVVAARWDALDVVHQRRALEALGLRLEVHRVTRRGPGFDPASIKHPDNNPWGHR